MVTGSTVNEVMIVSSSGAPTVVLSDWSVPAAAIFLTMSRPCNTCPKTV